MRSSTRTINSCLVLQPEVQRHHQHHNLTGGTLRPLAWLHTPAPAHTHVTLTPGRAAHAATNHYTFALLRGQVLARDDHPPGPQRPEPTRAVRQARFARRAFFGWSSARPQNTSMRRVSDAWAQPGDHIDRQGAREARASTMGSDLWTLSWRYSEQSRSA